MTTGKTIPLLCVLSLGCGGVPMEDPSTFGDAGRAIPASPGASGCDGSGPSVPTGFPTLGADCRSHFTYRWFYELFGSSGSSDEADPRGVRRIEDAPFTGKFDLGSQSSGEQHPIVMFLPSLTPGVYRAADGAGLAHVLLGTASTGLANGKTGVFVEIVGTSNDAIWGRFVARMCAPGGSDKDCFRFDAGRFSAARESQRSELEFGYPIGRGTGLALCETRADCPSLGSLPPLCQSGLCVSPAGPGPGP